LQALDAITGQTSPGLPITVFSADASAPAGPVPRQDPPNNSPSPRRAFVAPPVGPPGSAISNSAGKRGSNSRGVIVGSICVVVLLLLGAVLGGVLLRRRLLQHKAVCPCAACMRFSPRSVSVGGMDGRGTPERNEEHPLQRSFACLTHVPAKFAVHSLSQEWLALWTEVYYSLTTASLQPRKAL
jgi:hypothetical protein